MGIANPGDEATRRDTRSIYCHLWREGEKATQKAWHDVDSRQGRREKQTVLLLLLLLRGKQKKKKDKGHLNASIAVFSLTSTPRAVVPASLASLPSSLLCSFTEALSNAPQKMIFGIPFSPCTTRTHAKCATIFVFFRFAGSLAPRLSPYLLSAHLPPPSPIKFPLPSLVLGCSRLRSLILCSSHHRDDCPMMTACPLRLQL